MKQDPKEERGAEGSPDTDHPRKSNIKFVSRVGENLICSLDVAE